MLFYFCSRKVRIISSVVRNMTLKLNTHEKLDIGTLA